MTPIEKLIKDIEEFIELAGCKSPDGKISEDFIKGTKNGLIVAVSALKVNIPTEAEHTKQVGTGFAEWMHLDCINVGKGLYSCRIDNYLKVYTADQLWDEYILTLQNKKG